MFEILNKGTIYGRRGEKPDIGAEVIFAGFSCFAPSTGNSRLNGDSVSNF